MTPGWKTTEFWFTLIVVVLGALMASGLFADGSPTMRVAGMIAVVLKTLGYTASRTLVKTAAAANDNAPAPTDVKAAA